MRTFITTIKQTIGFKKASFIVSAVLVSVVIPAVTFAYGPDRATFTMANPATYVTFNSITDDPAVGDERNFFRVRDLSTGEAYDDTANLVSGHKYEAEVFYHNNAASNLNLVARNVTARVELPDVIGAKSTDKTGEAFINSSNANPQSIYDYITFNNTTNADIAITPVANSAKISNEGASNGQAINQSNLFGSGAALGFDSLNGNIPGCDHYAGLVTFQFIAEQPNFTFTKTVRPDGSGINGWKNNLTVNQGATVNYELTYTNSGSMEQKGVSLFDKLPAGVTYIPGSAKLYNGNYPDGKTIDDSIANGGSNIGDYDAGVTAYLDFSARIDAAPCTVLTNTATASTENGDRDASATVTVAGNCTAALPHTGPAQVIAGLLGIGAITFGVVYYLKSRRELDSALLQTQAHPVHRHSSKDIPVSAPDTAKADDVEAEHVHTKTHESEHKK